MTMRRFLDSGYALLVETFLRMGTDMLTAIEAVDEAIGLIGAPPEVLVAVAERRVPSAADNDRALAELKGLVGGLG